MAGKKTFKRLSDDELSWIRATFKDNEQGLITLRKILLQTGESETPVGFYKDSWTGLDLKETPADKLVLAVSTHQSMLNQIEGGLRTIQVISEQTDKQLEDAVAAAKKNSAR